MPVHFPFDNSYARLPARLYARLDPTPVAAPRLVRVNAGLAESLGLDPEELASREGVEVLAGNRIPDGATPIALAYAGHQFGHFVPQLGDGRAILLGEIVGAGRRAARHPAQGFRADALLARRRRPRRARPGAARIHCQRGHGGAGRARPPGRWPR